MFYNSKEGRGGEDEGEGRTNLMLQLLHQVDFALKRLDLGASARVDVERDLHFLQRSE
jgi:hypothetical protein